IPEVVRAEPDTDLGGHTARIALPEALGDVVWVALPHAADHPSRLVVETLPRDLNEEGTLDVKLMGASGALLDWRSQLEGSTALPPRTPILLRVERLSLGDEAGDTMRLLQARLIEQTPIAAPTADTCTEAIDAPLEEGDTTFTFALADATNTVMAALGNSCSFTAAGAGAEFFTRVVVPDGATLSALAGGHGQGQDPKLELVTLDEGANCAFPRTWTCRAEAFDHQPNSGDRNAVLSWTNVTGAPQTALIILDNAIAGPYRDSDLNTLTLRLEAP
ncbi:MAG: hypothetical protein AAFS10_07375, partial [Myxococcota bacterium]